MIAKPSRFLQQSSWQGYVADAAAERDAEAKITSALGSVRRSLGAEMFEKLREEMHENAIAALEGITLEIGPPHVFTVPSFSAKVILDNRSFALARVLGGGEVIVRQVPSPILYFPYH